jgi:hypothetical protein
LKQQSPVKNKKEINKGGLPGFPTDPNKLAGWSYIKK